MRILRRSLLALLLLSPLLALPGSDDATATGFGREHSTTHYDLYVEGGIDPVDTGAMLEALHGELTSFFGDAPARRLRIEIYATHERFLAALRRDGQPYERGGGLYGPTFGKVWLARQPTEAYTRQLILHEATHQFHFLTATDNRFPSALWYTEGLAEFMGMANWDGHALAVGVVPAISVEDYPERARSRFTELGWDLEGALTGRVSLGQAGSWALVHFLAHRDPRRFRELGRRLERRQDPRAAVEAVFGGIPHELRGELRTWLAENRQPWHWQWDSWLQRGDWIEGESDGLAVSTLKETPRRLEVELDPLDGDFRAGVVFGYRSPERFFLLSISDDRTLRVLERNGDHWASVDRRSIESISGRDVLGVEQTSRGVRLLVNGSSLGVMSAPGSVGLAVDGSRVRFRPTIEPAGRSIASAGETFASG